MSKSKATKPAIKTTFALAKVTVGKVAIVKPVPGSPVNHTNEVAGEKGKYFVLQSFGKMPTQELPKRERVNFKLLPLLATFLVEKRAHQKVSARGYVTIETLKHQTAGKELHVTPLDAQTDVMGVSEFLRTPPTAKEVEREAKRLAKNTVNGVVVPKAVRKVHAKVAKLSAKAEKAKAKLETKAAGTAGWPFPTGPGALDVPAASGKSVPAMTAKKAPAAPAAAKTVK